MSAPDKTQERVRLEKWSAENPRDKLALAMFAAWVNCPVDKIPPEMRGHTCHATMTAWARVADAARANMCDPTQDERQEGWNAAIEAAANACISAIGGVTHYGSEPYKICAAVILKLKKGQTNEA